ncbi:MAG: glycoside hydrolase family 28 protein [Gammaproteobacteria bacterium]|nr:glycoside hydrolase family 28 protein [Gammaproteobacteria bacterium]
MSQSEFKNRYVCTCLVIISISFSLLSCESRTVAMVPDDWKMAEEIVQKIELPTIPDKDFLVSDFGGVANDEQDDRPAIMSAIEKAGNEGGGRVVLTEGNWLSNGPIHLKSNINLHIAENAVLLFGPDPKDYLPVVLTRWEGTELYSYSPLIYAHNVHDVAITGKGTIDGNSESVFHGWIKKQEADQLALRNMGANGTPVENRVFAEGTYLRPSIIQFFDAKRVLLEDYTVVNSPFWINHLVYTDHAVVRNLNVASLYGNNDGVDVDSSRYVLIENNIFRTGDDSVVVKSGRDLDGLNIARPSENIVVRNNDMGGEDGIGLGSEMSGGIRNVFFTDNVLRKGSSAIRFKSNLDRGGIVEHIRVRNMTVESFNKLFWFQLDYPGLLGGGYPAIYRDIVFENFTVENAGIFFEAHAPKGAPLQDVLFKNIVVKNIDKTLILENVQNIQFENVKIGDQTVDGRLDWK